MTPVGDIYARELAIRASRQTPRTSSDLDGRELVPCAAFCKRLTPKQHTVKLTNGEYCCKDCELFVRDSSLLVVHPAAPQFPKKGELPEMPMRSSGHPSDPVEQVLTAFCMGVVFVIVADHVLGRLMPRSRWRTLSLLLFFAGAMVAVLVSAVRRSRARSREYRNALAAYEQAKPELERRVDLEHEEALRDYSRESVKYEASHEKHLWDAFAAIKKRACDYWPDYPPDWSERRWHILRRDGRCARCGSERQLQAHHKIPLGLGGSNREENLIALCFSCHALELGHERLLVPETKWANPKDLRLR